MEKHEYLNMYMAETEYWWYKALHELVELVVKKNSFGKELQIFDAGCGTGKMMEILEKYGEVEGIDYSKDALKFSKKRGVKNVKLCDLNNWNENKYSYNIIVCLDVLYHSGIKDDIEIIRKFYSALSNNGILILNVPAFNILRRNHDLIVSTKKRYRKSTIIDKIQNIGFEIKIASYRLPHLFIVILLKKLLNKLYRPKNMASDLLLLKGWLNKTLLYINRIENKLILQRITIPFGSSLFIVAKKN